MADRYSLFATPDSPILAQPPGRVRQQGIDQAGLRGEMTAQHGGAALVAGNLIEQPLKLGDVAVNRLLEGSVGAIFAAHFIERFLSGGRVESFAERLALAALI